MAHLALIPDSLGYTDAQQGSYLIHYHHSGEYGDVCWKSSPEFYIQIHRQQEERERERLGLPWVFETSKPTPRQTFSNKATPSNPSQAMPLPDDLAFKSTSLGGHSYSNHQSVQHIAQCLSPVGFIRMINDKLQVLTLSELLVEKMVFPFHLRCDSMLFSQFPSTSRTFKK